MILRFSMLVALAAGAASPALAQTDLTESARHAAVNRLGVLEYCRAHGQADRQAIEAEQSTVAYLRTGGGPSIDADEALGQRGTVSADGKRATLADMARRQHTNVGALCRRLARTAKAESEARRDGDAQGGGMPSLSNGIQSLPSMPPVPAAPGTTPGAPR